MKISKIVTFTSYLDSIRSHIRKSGVITIHWVLSWKLATRVPYITGEIFKTNLPQGCKMVYWEHKYRDGIIMYLNLANYITIHFTIAISVNLLVGCLPFIFFSIVDSHANVLLNWFAWHITADDMPLYVSRIFFDLLEM